MLKCYERKISCCTLNNWSHHHGGWNYLMSKVQQLLHVNSGTAFYSNGIFANLATQAPPDNPWIGVCHFALEECKLKFPQITAKLESCCGIYVHSLEVKKVIQQLTTIPVNFIWHGCKQPEYFFDWDMFQKTRSCLFVGQWLRRYDRFCLWNSTLQKKIVLCLDNNQFADNSITRVGPLSYNEYELALRDNVVFLDLKDASCNNTLIECIVRNTPIICTRLPATEEYLGKLYPLFFETVDELNSITEGRILAAHQYLIEMDKSIFSWKHYVQSLSQSEIYQSILN